MGKIRQGILGGFSGTVGNVVGSSWKSIDVIKSRPLSVANPKTAPQMAQRNAFSQSVAFAVIILANVVKPLWDRFAQRMSGFNAWIKSNIDNFDADGIVDYSAVTISDGKMSETPIMSVSEDTGAGELTVGWDNDSGNGYKLASDKAVAVFVNETKEKVKSVAPGSATRGDTSLVFNWGTTLDLNDVMHVYLAFVRDDGTVVSRTSYASYVIGSSPM